MRRNTAAREILTGDLGLPLGGSVIRREGEEEAASSAHHITHDITWGRDLLNKI